MIWHSEHCTTHNLQSANCSCFLSPTRPEAIFLTIQKLYHRKWLMLPVEHSINLRGGLMNGANYCPSLCRQLLQAKKGRALQDIEKKGYTWESPRGKNWDSVIFLPRNCYSWDGNKLWRIAGKAQARRRGDGETDQSDRGWGGWENASMRRTQPKASSEVTRSDTKQSIISKIPRD